MSFAEPVGEGYYRINFGQIEYTSDINKAWEKSQAAKKSMSEGEIEKAYQTLKEAAGEYISNIEIWEDLVRVIAKKKTLTLPNKDKKVSEIQIQEEDLPENFHDFKKFLNEELWKHKKAKEAISFQSNKWKELNREIIEEELQTIETNITRLKFLKSKIETGKMDEANEILELLKNIKQGKEKSKDKSFNLLVDKFFDGLIRHAVNRASESLSRFGVDRDILKSQVLGTLYDLIKEEFDPERAFESEDAIFSYFNQALPQRLISDILLYEYQIDQTEASYLLKFINAEERLSQKLGRTPTKEEVLQSLKWTESIYKKIEDIKLKIQLT